MQLLMKDQMLTDAPEGKTCIKSRGVKTFEPNGDVYFSISTALQMLQKIVTCFPEDKISYIYPDLQIQKVFTPRILMHCLSFWSISEHLNLH